MKMWEPTECPGTEELKDRLQTAREKLARQQMLLKEKKLPVLVLMEGWGTAGKGNCIGRVIQNIDPRFFNVESLEKKTEEEKRKPFLYRYFKRLPEAGKFPTPHGFRFHRSERCDYTHECFKHGVQRVERVRILIPETK